MAVSREVIRELIAKAEKPKQLPVEPDEHERDEIEEFGPPRDWRQRIRSREARKETTCDPYSPAP